MQYSIVGYKDVLIDNPLFRIDSEFFRKDYLTYENIIKKQNWDYLGNLSKSIINFGAYSLCNQINFVDDGVPFLNVGDIKENEIDYLSSKKIEQEISTKVLNKSLVKDGQVLLTIAGTIGNAAVAYKTPKHTNSNQAIANITLNSLSPFYLSIYLTCKYGKSQTNRLTISSVQPNLLLTQVKQIKVFVPSVKFQLLIESIYKDSFNIKEKTNEFYKLAENLILQELDLLNWQPKHNLWTVKAFSDTQQSQRMDAEYYQPKFETILNAIQNYSNGWDNLSDVVSTKKCVEVGSEAYTEDGIPFVRVSNLGKFEINENNQQYISETSYKELSEKFQPQKGEILLSKDGTAGIAYYLSEEPKKMIPSGGILRLKVKNKEYLPEYVTLVLNSLIVQEQIERVSSGALIKHWLIDQINNTVIPKLEIEKQKEIVAKIQESFKCREQSKQLLEIAKRGVEIAIEQEEEIATTWINQEFDKIGISLK